MSLLDMSEDFWKTYSMGDNMLTATKSVTESTMQDPYITQRPEHVAMD